MLSLWDGRSLPWTHSSIVCVNPCALRAHGFTQAMLDCFQRKLQPSHRLSKLAEPAFNHTCSLSCAQVWRSNGPREQLCLARRVDEKLQIYTHCFRTRCTLDHTSCCYRGCMLHILHAHVRVDSNVILF